MRGREKRGDYRGMGCSACHVLYSNDGFYEGDDKTIAKVKPGHMRKHQTLERPGAGHRRGTFGDRQSQNIVEDLINAKTGGRRRGDEDPGSHYRKGAPGDWIHHFTAEHRQYFKKRYNDVLLKLGYERDANW